ncbi:MAG: Type 1 glutamine amidotransferase-like domain-containing protein, partial [Myxococcales bacterium]|nr:Type 1 glutamine amidotransferase-like domain-containing protein [Myxococcales bacterium]
LAMLRLREAHKAPPLNRHGYGDRDVLERIDIDTLRAAWRARQDELARLRRFHRQRLYPSLQVVRDLLATRADGDLLADEALQHALADLRRIDDQLLQSAERIVHAHESASKPWTANDLVRRLTDRAHEVLRSARAVAITGGHVAVLLNRLQFFGVDQILRELHERGTPILAWSAGSMVLTERIVLYYDDPPDGAGHPELLDRGFGLSKGVVMLPHASKRLRLDDKRRVGLLATRFAPAVCIGLENGAWLCRDGDRFTNGGAPGTAVRLFPDGNVERLPQEES